MYFPANAAPARVRLCSPADAESLALIGAATFLEAYAGAVDGRSILAYCREHHSAGAWQTLLSVPANRAWLAEVEPGAAPIGYAALLAAPQMPADLIQPQDMELKRIYVFSRFHGTGLAQRLIQPLIEHARTQGATRLLVGLHPDNLRAMAFYHRQGFVEIGHRRFTVGNCCFKDPVLALNL